MSIYDPLRYWLKRQTVTATFAELAKVLGRDDLPQTARNTRQWWENSRSGHPQAIAWLDAGWKVQTVDLKAERVTFELR